MRSLSPAVSGSSQSLSRLEGLARGLGGLSADHQKLVAEIVTLRLFYILENSLRDIATALSCGTKYVDGSSPALTYRCKSRPQALLEMQVRGRQKGRTLKWSKAKEVKANVEHLIDQNDPFYATVDAHGSLIDEIRRVRNRIAHNNQGSRDNFQVVVERHYGSRLNSVTPGNLLLSTRWAPPLLSQYLVKTRVLIKTLAKA